MAYVRKKKVKGGEYYQLVEGQRVDGKVRQRVLVHLGEHPTVEDALKKWPRKIGSLRRKGHTQEADALKAKLDRLRSRLRQREAPWRVPKEFEHSEGIRWLRDKFARYDWSQCQWISVRRAKLVVVYRPSGAAVIKEPDKLRLGRCALPYGLRTERIWGYTLSVRPPIWWTYPKRFEGRFFRDEEDILVWVGAHEIAHYLYFTGQLKGDNTEPECVAFADKALKEFGHSYTPLASLELPRVEDSIPEPPPPSRPDSIPGSWVVGGTSEQQWVSFEEFLDR